MVTTECAAIFHYRLGEARGWSPRLIPVANLHSELGWLERARAGCAEKCCRGLGLRRWRGAEGGGAVLEEGRAAVIAGTASARNGPNPSFARGGGGRRMHLVGWVWVPTL